MAEQVQKPLATSDKTVVIEDAGTCFRCFDLSKFERVGRTQLFRTGRVYTLECTQCKHVQRLESNEDCCPKCKACFQGDEIPDDKKPMFGSTHFTHKGGEVINDFVRNWLCPFCGHTWER